MRIERTRSPSTARILPTTEPITPTEARTAANPVAIRFDPMIVLPAN